jgi:hypothetical protein
MRLRHIPLFMLILTGGFSLVDSPAADQKPSDDKPASQAATEPSAAASRLERLRQTKMPEIDRPIPFNTPEADAICSALEVFPPNSPWNQVIEDWPLHPDSKALVDSVGANKPMRYNPDINFILVPPNQKRVNVKLGEYGGESDKGPFPVPEEIPIEGWPAAFKRSGSKLTFDDVQFGRFTERGDGDRHAVVVDPVNRMLYEFYQMKRTEAGWEAAQASKFDLKTNALRPAGWTSTDAAGLPIFPALVRYDELKRGTIEHALRLIVRKSRKAYVYPARHHASRHKEANLPRMGERLRLRRDFDISSFSPELKTILTALKTYGAFVADNGLEWSISVTPDERIPDLHAELRRIKGSDFEFVTPPRDYRPPQK